MTRTGRALAAGAAFALLFVAALCGAADCPGYCATCTPCPTCPACTKRVPKGYEFVPGLGYYRLSLVPMIWREAKASCERDGAHLMIINSEDEANLVRKYFKKYPEVGIFIFLGFHDLYKEGVYTTVLGQPLEKTGYTGWGAGEPNNGWNDENCGSFRGDGLNDLGCEHRLAFICELPQEQSFGPLGFQG